MVDKAKTEEVLGVTGLRLKFPGEPNLQFKDLSFSVNKGQKVLLLGPSGCGKSTLLQVLCGIIPTSIEVPMQSESLRLPSSWGMVFQDPDTQFGMPYVDEELAFVMENQCVPREDMEARMKRVLEQVGLHLGDLHTPVGSLSQGMKQRLALAAVLLLDPEVLLLDEPSALLDPEGTVQIWDAIQQIAANRTLLIVEHKLDHVLELVDRVVMFDDQGQIIADGAPEMLFREEKPRLIEYGIWYPGVWNDYVDSSRYKNLMDRVESRVLPDAAPLVELRNFQGKRGKESRILIQHAEIRPGEWIALLGENGAGKSTLLLSMMQLLETEGIYRLQGKEVQLRRGEVLSDQLAFVFQNPELQFVTNSVAEELGISIGLTKTDGATAADDPRVLEMLRHIRLESERNRHPYQLSMGQKRRLSVATALIHQRPLLLLDEPTFGLDARSTFALLELIESWRQRGIAIVMVTHDPWIAEHFATGIWRVTEGLGVATSVTNRMRRESVGSI
ncbi:ATP-binding cassette domain-containing protein [Paenibacillus terrigena]|uniref:ABC transporter ATP-binding protein n=1 Tax=Paenibacillus terrigena TaxID=369333 RepID=UPI0028D79466|nr:ATP-binding cassette domain-containing protein [Paenibacillus terrigena]